MATPDGRYIAHPPSPGDGRRDPTAGNIRLERCGGGRLRAQPVKPVLASRDESVGSLVLQVKASAFPWPEGEPPAARLGPELQARDCGLPERAVAPPVARTGQDRDRALPLSGWHLQGQRPMPHRAFLARIALISRILVLWSL